MSKLGKTTAMVEINRFITRMDQGFTDAFLCGAVDQRNYIVKSKRAGKEALVREYVCGRIGKSLGLPIPTFELVYARSAVAQYSVMTELSDIVQVPGFGSRQVTTVLDDYSAPSLSSLNVADVQDVDVAMRRQVLLFDWWVLNADRIDGNPNLLWNPLNRDLHVIDHNLTFKADLAADFWENHIFRAERGHLSDAAFRMPQMLKMAAITDELIQIWEELPLEWLDGCIITRENVDQILRRSESDQFWNLP